MDGKIKDLKTALSFEAESCENSLLLLDEALDFLGERDGEEMPEGGFSVYKEYLDHDFKQKFKAKLKIEKYSYVIAEKVGGDGFWLSINCTRTRKEGWFMLHWRPQEKPKAVRTSESDRRMIKENAFVQKGTKIDLTNWLKPLSRLSKKLKREKALCGNALRQISELKENPQNVDEWITKVWKEAHEEKK